MERHGLNPKRWAELAEISPNALYNLKGGRSETLDQDTYQKLADAIAEPVFAIDGTFGTVRPGPGIRIIGEVAAGLWGTTHMYDDSDVQVVSVSGLERYAEKAYGLRVKGPSMDIRYPEGSVVYTVDLHDLDRDIKNKDHVIVRRQGKDGTYEFTIKEIIFDEKGEAWLWPRSTDPRYQRPWRLKGEGNDDHDEIRILAVVVSCTLSGPNNR